MPTAARVCPACQTSLPSEAQFCLHCGRATPTDPGVPPRTTPTGEIEVATVRRALADRYRIERVIGEGGMATVYLAEDLKHHRKVAVKVMRPELAATLGADRFLREVEIAAQLTHPHILPMYDSGEADGVLYYVMPHIEGESLAMRLTREGELPVDESIRLAREVADALGYAHKRGIVHRDVKPANILLNQGHALIADFGIARAVSGDDKTITRTGLAIGTPQYMSPEQASGDREVDNRTDIYALGAVLYEMLTGEPPFTGRTAQAVVTRSLTERPRPLGATRDGLPAGLEAVVAQALARSPADRQATAEVLAASLLAVESGSRAVAAPPVAGGRKWLALGAIAMAALTAVSFLAGRSGLPRWILWLALGLLAAGAVVLALTTRVERRRHAGHAPTGLAALLNWRNAGLGGLLAVISWAAVAAVASARRPASNAASTSVTGTRVAVLPFQNQGDSSENYIVDGITDEVRGKLSRISGLAVIASGSSNQFRGSLLPPPEIAKQLKADYLLVGRVRWARANDQQRRVQVVSELVNSTNGSLTWQQSFEANLTDVFQVQAQIAARVAAALGTQLGAAEGRALAKPPTTVPAAWDAYLRGKALTAVDPATLRSVIGHLEQAVVLDSTLVDGWAALSSANSRLYFNGARDPVPARRARTAFERAVALDSNSAAAQAAAAQYYRLVLPDIPLANRYVATALRLAPNDPDILVAAARAKSATDPQAAIDYLERAIELDPRSKVVLQAMQRAAVIAGQPERAIEAGETALALADRDPFTFSWMAMAYASQGNLTGATASTRLALEKGIPAPALAAHFAGYWEIAWILEPATREILFRLTPNAFDGDRAWWAQSLAMAHWAEGRKDVARAYADSALEPSRAQADGAPNDAGPRMLYAVMLAFARKHGDAVAHGQRALALDLVGGDLLTRAYNHLHMARVYLAGNEVDRALDEIEASLKLRSYTTPAWLRIDPAWQSLRNNPRFQRIVAGGA